MASKRKLKAKPASKRKLLKPKRRKTMAEREYYPKPKAPEPAVADAHPRGPKVMGQDKPDKKPDTAWRDAMANTPGEQIVEADTGGGQIVEAYKSGGLWRLKGSPRGSTDTIRVIRWRPKV